MSRMRRSLFAFLLCWNAAAVALAENATVATACFEGEPKSEFFEDIIVIQNEGYVVGFSEETRTPIWACYHLKDIPNPHKVKRPKNKKFATYSDGDFVVRDKDYSNSGYDRGHMAPSAGIGKFFGKDAQLATFKTTNICPQHPGLNQRCWERFESQVADFYVGKFDEVWVVTGPIFEGPCIELESDIRLPQAFYKIVVAKIDDNVEMLGIVMPNERTEKSTIGHYIHTVDEIEEWTGIDFFHDLEPTVEDNAEAKGTQENRVNPAWNPGWELRPTFAGSERPIHVRECD